MKYFILSLIASMLIMAYTVGYASKPCSSSLDAMDLGQRLLMDGIFHKAEQKRSFIVTVGKDRYEVYPRRDNAIMIRRSK